VSVGTLYHYFPTKRDLLLHALTQEALDRFCSDFLKGSFGLKTDDPVAFLEAYAESCAQTCLFVRPAARAAVELGTDTFWPVLDASMQNGLDNFLEALRRVVPGSTIPRRSPLRSPSGACFSQACSTGR
jgi:AcrR family transcriptional regulator